MDSIFAANEPNLGYLYQVRYGLFLIVSESNQDATILIEKIDDISIDTPNLLNIYQTKLHINSVANLTNASTDLWKTIRVWSDGIKRGLYKPENCLFNLITTAEASANTIPFKLKHSTRDDRNVEELQSLLNEVIALSKNETNKAGYNAFNALSSEQQKSLIRKISVIDSSVNFDEAKNGILKLLEFSTPRDKVNALYERLEGWFVNEVIQQLLNKRLEISKKEVVDKILDIADTLKADNLPAEFTTSIAGDESQLSQYRHMIFVKQLEEISVTSLSINHAISDYHRAFSQKSKWMRDGRINPTDESHYDSKLVDDWERKFAILDDFTGQDEEIKKNAGKGFYESHYVKSQPNIYIKERFKEQYMVLGSCQILSDKKKIGWHPDFLIKF